MIYKKGSRLDNGRIGGIGRQMKRLALDEGEMW